jgi:hypothetical protein
LLTDELLERGTSEIFDEMSITGLEVPETGEVTAETLAARRPPKRNACSSWPRR